MKGKSIISRKKALSKNTIKRIAAGLKKFGGANAEPFLVILNGTASDQIQYTAKSVDAPVPTQTTCGHIGLAQPFILTMEHRGSEREIDRPLPTITTARGGAMAVVEPFIVEPKSGRIVAELDILFRMLQPHELAAAMSFPKGYQFTGTRGDQVKQIGNAVAVNFARAHALALLS